MTALTPKDQGGPIKSARKREIIHYRPSMRFFWWQTYKQTNKNELKKKKDEKEIKKIVSTMTS